jgi:membrane-associated phospholipid phosphatase
MENFQSRWFFLPPLAALLLLILIKLTGSDAQVFLWINRACGFGSDLFWITLTTLGDGLVVCVIALPFVRRKPQFVWAVLLSWLLVTLWTQGLKFLFNVPRPLEALGAADFRHVGAQYRSKSFPSGHAASSAMFAAICFLTFKRKWIGAALMLLAMMIGLSRLAIGAHWPTDVLVGFLSGWLLGGLGFYLAKRLRFGATRAAQIIFGVILFAGAISMLFGNHTDYPQAFRVLQIIAVVCLALALWELGSEIRRARVQC